MDELNSNKIKMMTESEIHEELFQLLPKSHSHIQKFHL